MQVGYAAPDPKRQFGKIQMTPYDWQNIPSDEEIQASAGFVYRITCLVNGRKYIGKKLFTSSRRRKIACRKGGKTTGKKKVVRDRVDSNWRDYFGSSAELLADIQKYGKENFRREIIQLAPSKGVLSYYELKHQMAADAMLRSDHYNGLVNVRLGRNVFPKWMIEEADAKESPTAPGNDAAVLTE
jgi:hypothetical protein